MKPTLSSPQPSAERIYLLDVKIDVLTLDQFLKEIRTAILANQRKILSYVNIHALNTAFSTSWFRTFINRSDLTFCDGVGIKVAAKWTGQNLQHRFTPPDFMENISQMAASSGWRLFFLGAQPGVAEHAAEKLCRKFPDLQVRTHHGYFDKMTNSDQNRTVIATINQFRPHILVIGFGMPMQEKWILENFDSLDINIAFPAGALFDYLSGEIPRAPRWITDHGFEWLARLVIEPRRLWKRYIIGNPLFFWRVFTHHFLKYPLPK